MRLLHRILPMFGDLRNHTFVDLFAGGMNVGLNVDARHVVFNDASHEVHEISQLLSSSSPGQLEAELTRLIAIYGLSDTVANGYEAYGTDSSRGLAAHNRGAFLRLRDDFNTGRFTGRDRQVAMFALIVFGYNNHIQVRADGSWNNSVGKRDFNRSVRQNLSDTVARLGAISHEVTSLDFRDFDPTTYDSPFVYVDPPYSISAATYNRNWRHSDDDDLWLKLDHLTAAQVPWVMSNVVEHRGVVNVSLRSWIERRGYKTQNLDFDYQNVSHNHAARPNSTVEVVVLSPDADARGSRAAA